MDFASGLANLEQTASNAAQHGDNRRRPHDQNHYGEDRRRYQPRPRHHGPGRGHHQHGCGSGGYDRQLDALSRFGYRIPRNPYRRPPPIALKEITSLRRPLHICLLAITIDDMPYEHIWKAWAASNKNIHVSLVAHAKHPDRVQSDWLKQRLVLQPRRIVRGNSMSDPEFLSYEPRWGSVEITMAMMEVLVHGMRIGTTSIGTDEGSPQQGKASSKPEEESNDEDDPRFSARRFVIGNEVPEDVSPVDKFIFVSETCLPVTTLEECTRSLFGIPSSALFAHEKQEAPVAETKSADEASNKEKEEEDQEKEAPEQDDANKDDNEVMIHSDTSWVNARNFNSPNTPQNKYERDQFNKINRMVPNHYRWKADQWVALSRDHAAAVLNLDRPQFSTRPKDQLWNSFRNINASDEMYFPTCLSLAGILSDPPNLHNLHHQGSTYYPNQNNDSKDEEQKQFEKQEHAPWLQRRPVTYTDWSMGMRNPASFVKGARDLKEVARLARKKGCLFARKFAPCPEGAVGAASTEEKKRTGDISVEEWLAEIEEKDAESN